MTNEEVKRRLLDIERCTPIHTREDVRDFEALEMAIKALEQEPCEDCISRQYLLGNCVVDKVTMPYVPISKIENAPPVTQQLKYGKWIKHPEIETSTPEYLMFYECSECGDKQCFCKSDLHKKRFCNSCGAKMQESEDKV